MNYIGKVMQIQENFIVITSSSNTKCGACCKCGKANQNQITIKKPLNFNLNIGDQVKIELSEQSLIIASFLVYLLPIIFFFLAYIVLFAITYIEWLKISIAFIACAFSFIVLRLLEPKLIFIIQKGTKITKI